MRVPRISKRNVACLAIVFLLCWSVVVVAATQDKKTAAVSASGPDNSAHYVGSDNCKTCHEDQFKQVQATTHYKIFSPGGKGQEWHGCESCHGPGSAHVDGGGDKMKIQRFNNVKPEEITRTCMTCHESGADHRGFDRSVHAKNGLTCTSCHSVHQSKGEGKLLKQKSPALCFTCHADTRADFQKPFKHRVMEGYIQCQDCHNVHGSPIAKQLRTNAAQDAICYKCHAEKRGPFVFEHEPVRTEGCGACHTPHGSTNPRLLTRSRVNTLCLECHQNFYNAPHPQNTKSQACTMCHMGIHGSNTSNVFFK